MTFPDSLDDRLLVDGLNLRTTEDYTIEGVNGAEIDLRGNVKVNGQAPVTHNELVAGRAIYNNTVYLTIQAAIDAAELGGGGEITVRPGIYDEQISLDTSNRITVYGHGVTLRASGNGQTIAFISATLSVANDACFVGFKLDGNGFTGVIGLDINNTVGGKARNLYVEDCSIGVRFRVTGAIASNWTESCGLSDAFIYNCAVGIEYTATNSGSSLAQCWLDNVGVTGCTLGIAHRVNVDLIRVSWKNVTVWVVDNQTGVEFAGRFDLCRLQFNVESLDTTPVNVIGIHVAATATSLGDMSAVDMSVTTMGNFTQFMDNDSALSFTYRSGAKYVANNFGPGINVHNGAEVHPRVKIESVGIALGPGDVAPTATMQCGFADYVTMAGRYFFAKPLALDTEAASAVSGIVRAFEVWDKDTGVAVGWVPVYTTRTP